MIKDIKSLIEDDKFDEAITELKALLDDHQELLPHFKEVSDKWDRFKIGLSLGAYRMDQIRNSMRSAFDTFVIILEKSIKAKEQQELLQGKSSGKAISGGDSFTYVGFWDRLLALFLDRVILGGVALIFFLPIIFLLKDYYKNGDFITPTIIISFIMSIISFLLNFVLPFYLVIRYGGTFGKLIMGIRIVDSSGKYLSATNAALRESPRWSVAFLTFLMQVPIYLALINQDFDKLQHMGPNLWIILLMVADSIFTIVQIVYIVEDKKHRAVHDFIAKSFVVKHNAHIKEINK